DSTDVTMLLTAVDSPQADDPGALTRPEVCADRRQARPLNVRLDAGESVQQVRVGSVLNQRGDWTDLSAYAYFLYRDFDNRLAIPPMLGDGIVTFDRISPGGGVRWSAIRPLFGWPQSFTVGLDVQYQDDDRQRFLNEEGARGEQTLRQREQVLGVGPYIREAVELRDDLELSGGLRYDAVRFDVDVDYPPAGGDAGSRTFDHLSPGGGLRWSPVWWGGAAAGAPRPSFFGTIGTAFQTPTTTELANPDGPGFNPDVEPQTSVTYELGSRVQWRDLVQGGLSLYSIHIHDELVPFESLSGRTAYRNAGRSRRNGLELDWQATPLAPLRWSGALTLLDATYRSYDTPAGDFTGNQEPGIPPWQVYQELLYQHPSGAFAALEAFIVDGYFVNDANTASSGGYALLNLRAGYEHTWGRWTVAPFLGLNNLTDEDYDGTVRLNALGDRYYEPAPGFNVYGGLAVMAHL
ncbi:MAG: TonB-dependent receptor domain-containing protein, partial [Myxococcota bacterium]